MNWQPIETAPKDGTHLLMYITANRAIGIGWWNEAAGRFGDTLDWFHQPTHWMPLPAPPAQDETEVAGE